MDNSMKSKLSDIFNSHPVATVNTKAITTLTAGDFEHTCAHAFNHTKREANRKMRTGRSAAAKTEWKGKVKIMKFKGNGLAQTIISDANDALLFVQKCYGKKLDFIFITPQGTVCVGGNSKECKAAMNKYQALGFSLTQIKMSEHDVAYAVGGVTRDVNVQVREWQNAYASSSIPLQPKKKAD